MSGDYVRCFTRTLFPFIELHAQQNLTLVIKVEKGETN
jgi:hypothetical protein